MSKPVHYICDNKVFETLEEANGYSNLMIKKAKIVLAVFTTNRKVTHTFNPSK